jgi:hypothetical protein
VAGKLPLRILKHTATPVRVEEGDPGGDWIEGEPGTDGPEPIRGTGFPAVLFLPGPGGDAQVEQSWKPRSITRPTLLFDPAFVVGDQPGKDDELMILAPELAGWTGAAEARWQIDGVPQPFGPPGRVIGVQATLKQVTD